jgi:hypothetical protein
MTTQKSKFTTVNDFESFRNQLITERIALGGTKHNDIHRVAIGAFDSVFVSLMSYYHFDKQSDLLNNYDSNSLISDLTGIKNNYIAELNKYTSDQTAVIEISRSIAYIEYFISEFIDKSDLNKLADQVTQFTTDSGITLGYYEPK